MTEKLNKYKNISYCLYAIMGLYGVIHIILELTESSGSFIEFIAVLPIIILIQNKSGLAKELKAEPSLTEIITKMENLILKSVILAIIFGIIIIAINYFNIINYDTFKYIIALMYAPFLIFSITGITLTKKAFDKIEK